MKIKVLVRNFYYEKEFFDFVHVITPSKLPKKGFTDTFEFYGVQKKLINHINFIT